MSNRARGLVLIALAAFVTACVSGSSTTAGSSGLSPSPSSPAATSSRGAIVNMWKGVRVDPARIPLGDGHTSMTDPAAGRVYSCGGGPPIGGATVEGPWIHGDTWDSTAKVVVQGAVSWPTASYTMTVSGDTRTIVTNDLPTAQPTGTFPIAPGDPAYAYDRNPNSIAEHAATLTLPVTPTAAASPGCLRGGPIGILTNGVFLFDALDGLGRDAVAHEAQDRCGGHPAPGGLYHYHDIPGCVLSAAPGPSRVVGWAFDGFPIVVERDPRGTLPTNADLDECHGRTSPILTDGQITTMYHYSATLEYPYTLGCFRGRQVANLRRAP